MSDAPEPQDTVLIDVSTNSDSVSKNPSVNALNEKPRKSVASYVFISILIIGLLQLAGAVPLLFMNDTAGFGNLFGIIFIVMAIPFIVVGLIGTLVVGASYRKKGSQALVTEAQHGPGELQIANRRWLYIFFGLFSLSVAVRIATDKFGDEIQGWFVNLPFGILLMVGLYGLWMMILAVGLLGVIITAVMAFTQKWRTGHSDYNIGAIVAIVLLMALIGGSYVAAAVYREAEYERLIDEADRAISQTEAIKLIQTCQVENVDEYEGSVYITRMSPVILETGWSGYQSGHEVNEQEVSHADFVALKQELSDVIESGKCDDGTVDPHNESNNL